MNPKIRNQAFQYLQKNKFADAIPLLLKTTRKNSNDLEAYFALASAYAQTNRPLDAEKYLKHILNKSPRDTQACYALAYTQESIGKYSDAVRNFKTLLTLAPEQIDTYNHLGNIYLILGEFTQAKLYFQKYLEHDENNLDVLNNLGIIHMELEQYQDAEAVFSGILKQHPQHIHALNNLGNLYKNKGEFEKAENFFKDTLAIESSHIEAKYNWATIHVKNSNYRDAIKLLTSALEIKPVYNKASILLAKAYQATNEYQAALQTIITTITNSPSNTEAYQCFSAIIANTSITETNPELEDIILNTFKNNKIDHNLLVKPIISIIKNGTISSDIDKIHSSSASDVSDLLASNSLPSLFASKLLISLLQKTIISDTTLEYSLATLRNALLLSANKTNKISGLNNKMELICALSIQCYNTEYAYAVTEEEGKLVNELLSHLKEIKDLNKNHLLQVAVLSSYFPLHTALSTTQLNKLNKIKAIPSFTALFEQQVNAPRVESELKQDIKSLSSAIDEASQNIMLINEDAPYPRWISSNIYNNKLKASSIYTQLGLVKPEAPDTECFNILIAGCGTGKHSIEIASNYSNTHVTAIDISYNSLAYAMRKNLEYNIKNLDYYHADLLNLTSIDKQYDMIEVSGVLHHFKNPSVMLGKLLEILKPGGIIKIGAYSQRVREPINKIQKEITGKYQATTEGIREARQYVINNYKLGELGLANNKDFYSLSGCRYLLFGANDHNFTIDTIRQLTNDFDLDFLGFDIDDKNVQANYKQQFPDDITIRNLDNWDEFEALNPKTFANMYQFRCLKPTTD